MADKAIERPDQAIKRPDQAFKRPDQAIKRPDQDIKRPNQALKRPSYFTSLKNSGGYIFLLTVFSAILYVQDIFQDVLVISSSVTSEASYTVVSTLKVEEKKLGYFLGCTFLLSILIVGWDAMSKGNQLIIVKKERWLHVLMAIACLLNLGPVFFIGLKVFMRMERFKKLYASETDMQKDQQQIEAAMCSTKTKEAMCENLPMLVIVCFKMALSSELEVLNMISGASSACLLSKTIITYVTQKKISPFGLMKEMIGSLFLGSFIFVTLIMITTFAIESERDGILISLDPTREDSAGLVFLLLIFPTLLFCVIPFSIYDLIPFLFHDSIVIWEYFQKPPRKRWICVSILLCSIALTFNLIAAWFLFQRDPISFLEDTALHFTECPADSFVGRYLPMILCNRYHLKIGAGRKVFKLFTLASIILSMMAYFLCVYFILGMKYRDRTEYRCGLKMMSLQALTNLIVEMKQKESANDLFEECSALSRDERRLIEDGEADQKG